MFTRLIAGAAFAALLLPFTSAPSQAAEVVRGSIIPTDGLYVGSSLNSGSGFAFYANSISGYWSTTGSGTVTFIVFLFASAPVKDDVTLTVTSPGGNVVYSGVVKNANIGLGGTWCTYSAKGDYSKSGTYTVSASAAGVTLATIPLNFAPATH